MRLKKIPGALQALRAYPYTITNPEIHKGIWNKISGNKKIHLEIGAGRGQFLTVLASRHPDIHFIAIEKFESVMVKMLNKLSNECLSNLTLLNVNASSITEYFASGEIDRIYLNFSDPWPKQRHYKRRLTHENYLNKYKQILTPEGSIFLKTDNRSFFDFSIEQLANCGFKLEGVTYNLYKSEYVLDNIPTEYEERFLLMGLPIYRLEAYI